MFSLLHTSSVYLHDRTVLAAGQELEEATLFPFFDDAGAVRRVLLVSNAPCEMRVFDPSSAAVRRRWGQLELEGDLPRLRFDEARLLRQLWHFDPWWMFTVPPWSGRDLAAMLVETNCSGKLRTRRRNHEITRLYYQRDLTRVVRAVYGKSGQEQYPAFSACVLPERKSPGVAEAPPLGKPRWRLDPCWIARGKPTARFAGERGAQAP
jgi:hypothetical protein